MLTDLAPGVDHKKIYEETVFAKMSDTAFKQWMADIVTGKSHIPIFLPNFKKTQATVQRCIDVAAKYKVPIFQKIWTTDPSTGRTSLGPVPRLVVYQPVRRAAQTYVKKNGIPPHQKTVDATSGQPTGESKGARMSLPELKLASSMGFDKTATEFAKIRGGDTRAYAAMLAMLGQQGSARMSVLEQFSSGVESKTTMKTFFTAAHLKSNL